MELNRLQQEIILFLSKDGHRPANYDAIAHSVRQYKYADIQKAYEVLTDAGLAIEVRWGRLDKDEFGMKLTGQGRARARYIKMQREDR